MMCCTAKDVDEGGRAGAAAFLLHPSTFILCLLCSLFAVPASRAAETNGPTIHLYYASKESAPNPVADFMYFVPLISKEPVSSLTSPGCTQSVRITSATRSNSRHSFTVTCEAEITGDGGQQNIFDLARAIQQHESELQNGGSIDRMLKSINVEGEGAITAEVEGGLTNGVATVHEVRLRFNPHGHASPISIDMCDVHRVNGEARTFNEIVARVNTLTFRRQPGTPVMEVSVASVKNKDAGDSLWQNFKGRVAGAAVNMCLEPLPIEATGHQAMLDFGQALVTGAPIFTFPIATNLIPNHVP